MGWSQELNQAYFPDTGTPPLSGLFLSLQDGTLLLYRYFVPYYINSHTTKETALPHEPRLHFHHYNNVELYGQELKPGDILQANDRINNRVVHHWFRCGEQLAGSVMKETYGVIVIVRPLPILILGQTNR